MPRTTLPADVRIVSPEEIRERNKRLNKSGPLEPRRPPDEPIPSAPSAHREPRRQNIGRRIRVANLSYAEKDELTAVCKKILEVVCGCTLVNAEEVASGWNYPSHMQARSTVAYIAQECLPKQIPYSVIADVLKVATETALSMRKKQFEEELPGNHLRQDSLKIILDTLRKGGVALRNPPPPA